MDGREAELEQASKLLTDGKLAIDDDPEEAVAMLHKCLQIRLQHLGDDALPCAEAHLYYGVAMFEMVRAGMGALGEKAEKTLPAGPGAGPSTSKAALASGGNMDGDSEEGDEPGGEDEAAGDGTEQPTGSNAEEPAAGSEPWAGSDPAPDSADAAEDMELAWDNIERARVLYTKAGSEHYRERLAAVYDALADVNSENDNTEAAVDDYLQAIELLQQVQEPIRNKHRRLAGIQYKLAYACTYCDMMERALQYTQDAVANLKLASEEVEQQLNALPADADEEGERLQASLEDMAALIVELKSNIDWLKQAVDEQQGMREVIRETLLMAVQGGLPSGSNGAGPSGAGGASTSAAAGSSAPASAGGLGAPPPSAKVAQDLGVVGGRGSRRITLQPVQASAVPAASSGAAPVGLLPGADAPPGKRSFSDIMGGSLGGITSTGFGPPPAAAPVDAPAKRPKAEGDSAAAENQ